MHLEHAQVEKQRSSSAAAAEQSKVRSSLGLSDGEEEEGPRRKRFREHHSPNVEARERRVRMPDLCTKGARRYPSALTVSTHISKNVYHKFYLHTRRFVWKL